MDSRPSKLTFTCEICGKSNLNEEQMRKHIKDAHVSGNFSCPLCDLGGSTSDEILLHVNSHHLNEFLTPEKEEVTDLFNDDEEFTHDLKGIWELEKEAQEGLTKGLTHSPVIPERSEVFVSKGECNDESPMSTCTELSSISGEASITCLTLPSPKDSTSSKPSTSFKEECFQRKSKLSLDLRSANVPSSQTIIYCPICNFSHTDFSVLNEHVNRLHFETPSPTVSSGVIYNECPLCTQSFDSHEALEFHVNKKHSKELGDKLEVSNEGECPVCGSRDFSNVNELTHHVNLHFWSSPSPKEINKNEDFILALALDKKEREQLVIDEKKNFEILKAQYGMDNEGNFLKQSISNMEKAVYTGELSVVDFYERKVELKQSEQSGMDDGSSVTFDVMPSLKSIISNSNDVFRSYLCSSTIDHYSSSFGDKGWGCGYRNLQMLLSSIQHQPDAHSILTRHKILTSENTRRIMPSIGTLQKALEKSWRSGYDTRGSDQLGGKVHETRKWIGATEIVAFLTAHGIKTEILDFHEPSGKDGTHPALFQWVSEYFQSQGRATNEFTCGKNNEPFIPPLYLQHHGHSRTIVGIEVLKRNNATRLLILDPSHSRSQISKGLIEGSKNTQVMGLIRKNMHSIKSRQYQIVSVTGVFSSENEAAAHKTIKSKRIS